MKKDEELRQLEIEAKTCKQCRLHKTRTNVVFGSGSANAEILLLGEGPGFTEDQTKIPFSGAAGKYLDNLLHEVGLRRENLYVTNVVLCRPPQNRAPLPDEIEACKHFLEGHISVIRPKFIVALGRTAAETLLGKPVVMGKEHGGLLECAYAGVKFKLFITYHPAAALYGVEAKQKLKSDFKKLGQILKQM
jgi:DNA polymerase